MHTPQCEAQKKKIMLVSNQQTDNSLSIKNLLMAKCQTIRRIVRIYFSCAQRHEMEQTNICRRVLQNFSFCVWSWKLLSTYSTSSYSTGNNWFAEILFLLCQAEIIGHCVICYVLSFVNRTPLYNGSDLIYASYSYGPGLKICPRGTVLSLRL
jgi:hypothetical protein